MANIIDFEPIGKDTHTPLLPRSNKENAALKKMIGNVVTVWWYPSDEAIQTTLKRTKSYTLRAVDVWRISHNDIPAEFVTSTEEMYEDITEHFEVLKKYTLSPASIGFSMDDFEIWKRILLTHRWLIQYNFRIIQDPNLYDAVQSFSENIWPVLISKLGNKLWLLDDVSEWSDLEERVLYELDTQMNKNKRATS